MVEIPETRYARNGPVNLAYQTVGDGPIDMLRLEGGITHLDYRWQYEPFVHLHDRLTAFSRLVIYDKRGSGLSDRTVEPPTTAESVADAVAILDELDIGYAYLFGQAEGGSAALALAAAHPARVAKVAVYGACGCRKLCRAWSGGISVVVDRPVALGGSGHGRAGVCPGQKATTEFPAPTP